MLVPVWAYPYVVRGFLLWGKFVLQDSILYLQATPTRGRKTTEQDIPDLNLQGSDSLPSPDSNFLAHDALRLGMLPSKEIQPFYFKIAWFFHRNRWVFGWKGQLSIFSFIFLASWLVTTILYFFDAHKYPLEARMEPSEILDICDTENVVNVIIFILIFGLVGFLICIVLLWNVRDAFLLKLEFILNLFAVIPIILLWILSTFVSFPAYFSRFFWARLGIFLTMLISLLLPLVASYRFERLLTRENPESSSQRNSQRVMGREIVDAVLKNPHLAVSFEQFCRESWALENLLFYLHAVNFSILQESQLEHQAKKIWRIYFESGFFHSFREKEGGREN